MVFYDFLWFLFNIDGLGAIEGSFYGFFDATVQDACCWLLGLKHLKSCNGYDCEYDMKQIIYILKMCNMMHLNMI